MRQCASNENRLHILHCNNALKLLKVSFGEMTEWLAEVISPSYVDNFKCTLFPQCGFQFLALVSFSAALFREPQTRPLDYFIHYPRTISSRLLLGLSLCPNNPEDFATIQRKSLHHFG